LLTEQTSVTRDSASPEALASLPGEALLEVRNAVGTVAVETLAGKLPIDAGLAHRVAKTMTLADTHWGTLLRIESVTEQEAVANRGIVFAINNGEGWLFDVDHEQAHIYAASLDNLTRLLGVALLTNG
jgi:hypothetical protein